MDRVSCATQKLDAAFSRFNGDIQYLNEKYVYILKSSTVVRSLPQARETSLHKGAKLHTLFGSWTLRIFTHVLWIMTKFREHVFYFSMLHRFLAVP